ncbi:MAG: [FeFe] hydrogenase H-cluster radical SAM maturase HydE [Rikenellaceae bacterium]|nr:[FeFe] hydrogenase H-cluster radical SAM maturase HydE [Rikenellaceae bacterium]MCL2692039.1 [FeFe] hydrogenase H-cluster radical SAM maturase HydE [Rikenellaceae bacterium]
MNLSRDEIIDLLNSEGEAAARLFERAAAVRDKTIGNGIYLRGLIEYSNLCVKNCLYCGIRRDAECERYTLTRGQVLAAAEHAWRERFGSVVLQGGENRLSAYIADIERLVKDIKTLSRGELGITLSLGEQSLDTYRRWFAAGAHRYLLRIETSNRALFERIHPAEDGEFDTRLQALHDLRAAGYQVGTGVMIGLPGQTVEDLADDLLFMRALDIDMCGMGPYIPSAGTPLAAQAVWPAERRMNLTLNMIAVLRLLMPDINIAATTALQAIVPDGRLRAVAAGANVIMPNLTPDALRKNYSLYDNKPLSFDTKILEANIRYGEWGDSKHFFKND